MKDKYSVIVADDHPLIRMGVKSILKDSRYEIIYEAQDGAEALEKTKELLPDILITDISMPKMTGIEILAGLRDLQLPIKTAVLSMHGDHEYISGCLDLGARAYLLKDSVKDDLIIALDQLARDEYFFCKEVLNFLLESNRLQRPKPENPKKIDVVFTGREKEILNLLTAGLSSKEIGEKLFISPRTVDAHKYNIMQKLNVNSSSELVYFALKNQLL